MKTFETEKHNIPEGATHYADETTVDFFAWVKFIGGDTWRLMPDSKLFNKWQCRKIDNVKPIPQTNIETPEEKEVEWINGDTVEYHNKHEGEGGILTFVGIHPTHKDHAVLYGKHLNGGYMSAPLSMLSKPETEAERVEREELEAAYDLYCHVSKEAKRSVYTFEVFCDESLSDYKIDYLAVVRKTGYRKDSE